MLKYLVLLHLGINSMAEYILNPATLKEFVLIPHNSFNINVNEVVNIVYP